MYQEINEPVSHASYQIDRGFTVWEKINSKSTGVTAAFSTALLSFRRGLIYPMTMVTYGDKRPAIRGQRSSEGWDPWQNVPSEQLLLHMSGTGSRAETDSGGTWCLPSPHQVHSP